MDLPNLPDLTDFDLFLRGSALTVYVLLWARFRPLEARLARVEADLDRLVWERRRE